MDCTPEQKATLAELQKWDDLREKLRISRAAHAMTARAFQDLRARLPHTADGVVIIPPMECWLIDHYNNDRIVTMPVHCIDWFCNEWLARNWDEIYPDCRKVSDLYSAYAEAEKALHTAMKGSQP